MESRTGVCGAIRNSILILVFEFIGTAFLTLLFNTSNSQTAGFLLGFWVLIIFSARISGSHFNPAVSLAFMFRKEVASFNRPLGLAYMLFQVLGGFVGALVCWAFTGSSGAIAVRSDGYIFQGLMGEMLGSFFLCFMYLT